MTTPSGKGRVAIKPEPIDSNNEQTSINTNITIKQEISSSPSPAIAPSNENIHVEQEEEEEEDDEIIREIDVYISPQLAQTLHLIQFPLAPSSSQASKNLRAVTGINPHPPLPDAARIKPQNSILNLDYPVPSNTFSAQRQVPEALNLGQRTLSSSNVPIVTHMALGVLDKAHNRDTNTPGIGDGTGSSGGGEVRRDRLDLVPLNKIMQMRPTFHHVDALFQDDDNDPIADATARVEENKPIGFTKPETKRQQNARMNSHAFKKATEDAEDWVDLDVVGFKSVERRDAMMSIGSSSSFGANSELRFNMPGGAAEASAAYVKSLNYLPHGHMEHGDGDIADFGEDENDGIDVDDDDDDDIQMGDDDNNHKDTKTQNDKASKFKRNLTARVATLLQNRGGVPIPYPVIRERFPRSKVSDEDLVEALSASAALLRGNFVLKSSLVGFSQSEVADARDFILVLLHKFGFVQRDYLLRVYEDEETNGKGNAENKISAGANKIGNGKSYHDRGGTIITADVLNSLLDLVARKTLNGMEMKLDDDLIFESKFGADVVKMHDKYWERKEEYLEKYVLAYEIMMEEEENK